MATLQFTPWSEHTFSLKKASSSLSTGGGNLASIFFSLCHLHSRKLNFDGFPLFLERFTFDGAEFLSPRLLPLVLQDLLIIKLLHTRHTPHYVSWK